ncbi:DUF2637 domain-containing protein [Streptomyces sp. Amel2xB2]|uniref:DUF2637 domain-containing protein n=1 Tax=Streptomyces sp. Amel2xB2 TaxID=1305829 RepID=UPI0015EC6492|nr:DUF2637 domain-containing protein [Streptomyces sp. Amel2xB2]
MQPATKEPRNLGARFGSFMRDTGLGSVGFALVLVVAVAGWSASFIGLHDFATKHMGLNEDQGWLVPITFDGAPLGLTLVVYRASVNGRGAAIWRLLIFAFTGLSSWINWQHIDDPTGRWIASFMPPAAVILFEGLMSEARASASDRPRLHPLRWLIDREGTWKIYRAYILGIELPEHLTRTSGKVVDSRQKQPAKKEPAAAKTAANSERQVAGSGAAKERQEATAKTAPAGAKKAAPGKRQQTAKKGRQSAAKTRRSMDEWVELGTPVFHAEFKRLRRQPTGTEFANALAEAGLGKPGASTAKNIRTEILDREPLPALTDPS